MSVSERYNKVLLDNSEANLKLARDRRLHIRELWASIRKKAEEDPSSIDLSSGPASMQYMITKDMRQQLADLGYSREEVKSLTPADVADIIERGVTKGKSDASARTREKTLDMYEEKTLNYLEKAKKKLEDLKSYHKKTKAALDKETDRSTDLSAAEDDRGAEWVEDRHVFRLDGLVNSQMEQIHAQEKLIQRIIESEDGLIEELQELNESATATPTLEDDHILEQIIKSKVKDLLEIGKDQDRLDKAHKNRSQLDVKVHNVLKKQRKLLDQEDFNLKELNDLDDDLEQAQEALDAADKDVKSLYRTIMRHERNLLDKQTEQRIIELQRSIENAHKPLPEFEKIVEESKKEIDQEDPGQEAAGKTKYYKDQSDAMLAFFQKIEPQFRDFVTQFIGPDIPTDPAIEKALRIANAGILKRTAEMYKLAGKYRRNDMHRSAILLAPSFYEVLARNMDAVLSDDEGSPPVDDDKDDALQVEASALFDDLVSAGMLKEALGFREMFDAGKDLGTKAVDKSKELGHRAKEGVDQLLFNRKDTGPRRDFNLNMQQARDDLKMLRNLELELKAKKQHAEYLLKHEQDPQRMRRIRESIRVIDENINSVGEKKNVAEQGLSGQPAPGMMEGVEPHARSSKSDYQHAVGLMQETLPSFVKFFSLIPDDAKLEQDMLRQSDRISKLAQKLVRVAFKAKNKYPLLPPTIQAYGHMFMAIDDALDRALRSNAGLGEVA